jgi:uncharacterized damage-inducible protein DinB
MTDDQKRLSEFATAIRESTLKRLRRVPDGLENWRYERGKMSFADLAWHLVECDRWMQGMLAGASLSPILESHFECAAWTEYETLLGQLESTGRERSSLLASLTSDEFERPIYDPRAGREVTVWWFIVRGNLDHEIHHRGQLALLLNLAGRSPRPGDAGE